MLPIGVLGRTQERFGGLPVATEVTHHQLIVAAALASEPSLFFAGLLHDIFKPLLRFEKRDEEGKWSWRHLPDKEGGGGLDLRGIICGAGLPPGVDVEQVINIISGHHVRDEAGRRNPVRYVEGRMGLPVVEATLLPSRQLEEMGLHVCVEARGLRHPYHYFVLNLIYQGLKYRLNEVYGRVFSEQGVSRLKVEYLFGGGMPPVVRYAQAQGGELSITYYVPSRTYDGLRVRHEYGRDLRFGASLDGNVVSLRFGWSDILTFLVPHIDSEGIKYRIACVVPGSVKQSGNGVTDNQEAIGDFKREAREALDEVVSEIVRESDVKISYDADTLLNYLEGGEEGNNVCVFCGRRTRWEVRLAKSGLLSERFTDYHRVGYLAEGRKLSVCPLCHLGFSLEEELRGRGPSLVLPLPAEPVSVDLSDDFRSYFESKYGEAPINVAEGVVPTILGLSTMQIISQAWYESLLEDVASAKEGLPWLRVYNVRRKKNVEELHLGYLISRKVLLYPLEVKVRPKALISSYGGRNKKFVLNTDVVEGHQLWMGDEHDLTEDQLDALEPLLKELRKELSKAKIRDHREIFSRVVGLYGLSST